MPTRQRFCLLVAVLTLEAVACAKPIDVGDRKQLFIDHRFIAASKGVELRVNPPVKQGVVLRGERPWEEGGIGASLCERSSIVDDGSGQYKLYYPAYSLGHRNKPGAKSKCLAVSQDGVRWTRPNLGLTSFGGSSENNILLLDGEYYFVDPKAGPEQRYKVLTVKWGKPPGGIFIHHSPDGIHWTAHPTCVLPFAPDSQNQVFYDTRLGKYVAYLRAWRNGRTVVYDVIDNLLEPWPYDHSAQTLYLWGKENLPPPSHELPLAISFDKLDPPETDIYTPCVVQYLWADDAYFAFPSVYRHPTRSASKTADDGLLEVQLGVSRDGARFERPDRRAYIPLGVRGGPEGGCIYMTTGMIRHGDEIYQYYLGSKPSHDGYASYDELRDMGAIYLAVQRLDGFMSADASYREEGSLTTPPIRFAGARLELNVDCGAVGHALVEIRDGNNAPLEGFAAGKCDLIRGNHVCHVVTWAGKSDVSKLAGAPVRLHVRLRNAKLYAFQFCQPQADKKPPNRTRG